MRDLRKLIPRLRGPGTNVLKMKKPLPLHMRTKIREHLNKSDPTVKDDKSAKPELPFGKPADRVPFWHIFKGDYVYVHQGPLKGKWGRVVETNKYTNGITIEGVNVRSVKVPIFLLRNKPEDNQDPVIDIAHEVHYANVRLLAHAKTDAGEPVLIPVKLKKHSSTNLRSIIRPNIEGVQIHTIHLPRPKTEDKPKDPEGKLDTKNPVVSKVTWSPSLSEPPLPPFAIGDLRANWSRRLDRIWGYKKNNDDFTEIAKDLVRAETAAEDLIKKPISPNTYSD
ncbi:54S ribosomal protein L40, mitochondrial [Schizosaccharomyces pombe]|uniref:Large ribosomal subunit protein uL24m n=1 Tax=Schizosaccharomyces pombe (strain 972 / ATCC 24843) TaxID=284812 RepID=RM40_SCHPO|nr:putative mitochondrial ribosomal protein subunit L40 [Schizosaccharomyces pombe]O14178.1 RecName: Full=Large ribosomal subunit protein uL24m; AltName: Full=54S ribosomal protein L40, mitochondrial; Flags: Precursor [Schizosaccharomyces pombe 972h-]CAB11049.1 mitochondrial ribosomal protein subunit L40 (predicted) [Schizosaccharomyces pombe]|eukprot:NP_593870.1 putative mitochondrial ribosomal protein subunit L40 [Schizosaccharomyces pombe]